MLTTTPESEARRNAETQKAISLHVTLGEIDPAKVLVVCRERHMPRKTQARLARELFRQLGAKGVSFTTPNYSMASGVDVRLPKRSDYTVRADGMITAALANHEAEQKVRQILALAFPNHDDRSDSMTDYYDACWSFA